jgi:hypothetical protein
MDIIRDLYDISIDLANKSTSVTNLLIDGNVNLNDKVNGKSIKDIADIILEITTDLEDTIVELKKLKDLEFEDLDALFSSEYVNDDMFILGVYRGDRYDISGTKALASLKRELSESVQELTDILDSI